ncbi:MAG: AP2 domain-containing protein [Proteobacteria bacterium]|nr:AP2 domain-containing protein [Pseudomonadota bacterium]
MKEDKQQSEEQKCKSITRVDQEEKTTHGWYVRIRFLGEIKSKFFSDKKNGGSQMGFKKALAWRNATEKKIGKIRSNKRLWTVPSSKSGTGVVGVNFSKASNRYVVSWVNPEGQQKNTSFSVRKYGKEAAFIKACLLRQEKDQERLQTLI